MTKVDFEKIMVITIKPIGIIHTPYSPRKNKPPFQPVEENNENYYVSLFSEHTNRIQKLELFNYIYLIYWLDRTKKKPKELVNPPWLKNEKVGLFASRSPNRINPIGLSVVKIKKIINNQIYISGIDAFDNTPLLDIKPYIKDLDEKTDANNGWLETSDFKNNFQIHIKNISEK